jgi:(1->4)-alpha-D-glucan 1-alpha-D-glucosylmutase
VRALLSPSNRNLFVKDLCVRSRTVAWFGMLNSLSMTLLKLASPGVPDIYQGCELWDLSLVDPDNRRPVDFESRAAMLSSLKGRLARGEDRGAMAASLLTSPDDGAIKLYLHWTALEHRREQPGLYSRGAYLPLHVDGPHANRVVAFARHYEGKAVVGGAPRLVAAMMGDSGERLPIGEAWESTSILLPPELSRADWSDRLTGQRSTAREENGRHVLPLSEVLSTLPLGLLESQSEG